MSVALLTVINLLNYCLYFYIYTKLGQAAKIIGSAIFIIQNLSQIFTTIINPGIPHKNNYLSDEVIYRMYRYMKENNIKFDKYRVCSKCNILVFTSDNVTHCNECDICVEDLDHHCVWIGKCIAKRNTLSFQIFVVFTLLFFIFAIISLFWLIIKAT